MGRGSTDERRELLALLQALKEVEEQQQAQQAEQFSQQPGLSPKQKQNKRQKGQKGQRTVSEKQQQEQQQQMEGGQEEQWLSAFSALPEAGTASFEQRSPTMGSGAAGMGASILGPGMGAMVPDSPVLQYRRSDALQAMSTREAGAVGGVEDSAAAPVEAAATHGSWPRLHMHFQDKDHQQQQQQQRKQRREPACEQQLSYVAIRQPCRGSAGSAGIGVGDDAMDGQVSGSNSTGGMGGTGDVEGTDGQWHCDDDFGLDACFQLPVCNTDAEENQCGGADGWCAREERGERRHESGERHESEGNGHEHNVHDECGTEDEWLPRSQGIRSGLAPNQRIKRRSMAERRRRERISEKLQRLRAKVRGREDTCAMLDRAVGYVDALERRVMELERVVMTAAGSGRNVFPGNAFAGGGAFPRRGFGGNVFLNNAAALATIPAALTSARTGLGSDAVADWPWE
ncbi:unnamed protein product [Closterium sp. NIES-65]|nr:unnamed protein product [Closterium sp. NIES-65]